jgi:hypothetical protein
MAVSRNEMEHAASMVRAIAAGEWTNEWPSWVVNDSNGNRQTGFAPMDSDYGTRAVQTAESFILFFQAFNPRFDVTRFLIACDLQDAPAKRRVR